MRPSQLTALTLTGLIVVVAAFAAPVPPTKSFPASGPVRSAPSPDELHRGVSWVARGPIPGAAIEPLSALGANWIVQTPFGWQRHHDSPSLMLATDGHVLWGETDEGLTVTTRLARELGIDTLLKPHVWLTGARGKWRADIAMNTDEEWQRWFADYRRFILHYARLAEQLGIGGLAVGTELHATIRQRPDDWRRLIADVRAVYGGKLTYSANWYREFEEVAFWEELDYIGIQAYFPLTEKQQPSVDELMAGWQRHLPAIEAVARRTGKPVLFTEMGYRNTADAAIEPWRWPDRAARLSGATDPETQARCYEAFFRTFWHRPWFAGIYVWKWFPGRGVRPRGVSFTPQGQAAEAVLARWYGGKQYPDPPGPAVTTPE
ncbi:MAG: glycoside hydrolase TIM-barrel-like domain-containing protein [Thermoanaerobaculia bacterium]